MKIKLSDISNKKKIEVLEQEYDELQILLKEAEKNG